jgi:hypothetical protein
MILTDKQYVVLLELFHELHDAFLALPQQYRDAFYNRLSKRN